MRVPRQSRGITLSFNESNADIALARYDAEAALVTAFNPNTEFSLAANPNGLWSYGFTPSLGGSLTRFSNTNCPQFGTAGLDAWCTASINALSVANNNSGRSLSAGTYTVPPGFLAFHPGPSGELAVLRWTAPSTNVWRLGGWFQGLDRFPTTTDVHVLVNGNAVVDGVIDRFGVQQPFDLRLSLTTGDQVDFAVGFGGNGNYIGDPTGLQLVINNSADLAVTKSDLPDPVTEGKLLTYTITVTNNGPEPATGVTMTDMLLSGVTFARAIPSQGSCSGTSGISCNLDTLADSATARVHIEVRPTAPGGISNTATVNANEPDPVSANNTTTVVTTVNPDNDRDGYSPAEGDCNDTNPAVHPGAVEICNEIDDNCDGRTDEGFPLSTFYQDSDSDGFGNLTASRQACSQPIGYVADSADCNDANAAINPRMREVCNGVDDNCDERTDDVGTALFYRDADGDGYGTTASTVACSAPAGYAANTGDCNDADANTYPGAVEICGDGIDQSCNGFDTVCAPAPGALDLSFGTGGRAATPIGSEDDFATALALQNNGQILVAGYTITARNADFALAAYNQDGSPSNTFGGTDGKVITSIGSGDDFANAAAIQSDGKIIVAGITTTSGSGIDFAVVRYAPDGTLDPDFGSGGKVTTPLSSGDDEAAAVALQPDGKILVAGTAGTGDAADFVVVRYQPDGTLDASFGTGGKIITPIGSGADEAFAVTVQPGDKKILVAGTVVFDGTKRFALVRYNPDGTLDTSFGGTDGKVATPIGSGDAIARAVALQGDKILVAGYAGSPAAFALARYTSTGSLDTTFSEDGSVIVTTPVESGDAFGRAMAVQGDGKILVAGNVSTGDAADFALVRYTPSGGLDQTFGLSGKAVLALSSGNDEARAIALQPNGKILVAGRTYNGTNSDFALVHYLGDPDGDGDGHAGTNGDCNDQNSSVHPGAAEICGDGIDQDCNSADCPFTADVPPGDDPVTVSTAPATAGEAGVTASLTNNTAGSEAATVTVENYDGNPTTVNVIDVGGEFVDLKVDGADPTDSVSAYFYYPSSFAGAENTLQLLYFTGSTWEAVRSSGNTDPLKDTTDNLDGTISSGRFAVTFDNTSTPKVTELTGTVFTPTKRYGDGGLCRNETGHGILQPINADGTSVFRKESIVPAKFRVCDTDGVSVGTPGVVAEFKLIKKVAGTVVQTVNEPVLSTTPDVTFRWDSAAQQWIFNISTKSLMAGSTYFYRITLDDLTLIEFNFGLK